MFKKKFRGPGVFRFILAKLITDYKYFIWLAYQKCSTTQHRVNMFSLKLEYSVFSKTCNVL